MFDAKLGGTPVRVMLDSGNPGASIDRAWLATLQASGAAMPFSYMDNEATYRLVRIGFSLLKHLGVTWH